MLLFLFSMIIFFVTKAVLSFFYNLKNFIHNVFAVVIFFCCFSIQKHTKWPYIHFLPFSCCLVINNKKGRRFYALQAARLSKTCVVVLYILLLYFLNTRLQEKTNNFSYFYTPLEVSTVLNDLNLFFVIF